MKTMAIGGLLTCALTACTVSVEPEGENIGEAGEDSDGLTVLCFDGNPCSDDRLVSGYAGNFCTYAALPGGTACALDDCYGTCFPPLADGTPGNCGCSVHCEDDNPCTRDTATPTSCEFTAEIDGTSCEVPGGLGVCLDGACCLGVIDTGEPWSCISCDDGNACTWDTGYDGCLHYPQPDGFPCGAGECNGRGQCVMPAR